MQIRFHRQSRIPGALEGLLRIGWKPHRAPIHDRALRNGQRLILQAGTGEKRVRIFSYTVTGSSRNRPHERRVEITSTYQGGMQPDPLYEDAVIALRSPEQFVGRSGRRAPETRRPEA